MKKNIKRLIATVTVGLALVGAGGLTAFASGYITWGGSQNFRQTLVNLDLINERGQDLKTSNESLKASNEELKTSYETLTASNETLTASNETLTAKNGELTTNNENINRELEQTRNQLLDKDNQINALNQKIEALEKRVEGGQTAQDQLGQAEKDMEDVKTKSEEVLSSFDTAE